MRTPVSLPAGLRLAVPARIDSRHRIPNRSAKCMNVFPPDEEKPVHVVSMRMGGFAPETMWDEWDQERYANVLLAFLRHKIPDLTLDAVFTHLLAMRLAPSAGCAISSLDMHD